jgi:hypothetical protein
MTAQARLAMRRLFEELTGDGYCSPSWEDGRGSFSIGDVTFSWPTNLNLERPMTPVVIAAWPIGNYEDFVIHEQEVDADLESIKTFVVNLT